MSSTTAATQALTTPYVAPQSCTDQFVTTSFISSFFWNDYSTTTVQVLASGPADSRFSACQPQGWDQGTSFQFSPAVCPSGWTAHNLEGSRSAAGEPATQETTYSTAFCCSSGFSLSYLDSSPIPGILSTACFEDIVVGEAIAFTSTSTAGSQTGPDTWIYSSRYPNGFRVHNAWHISWASSDVATLSPPPPQLQCTTSVLPTWLPGATVAPSLLKKCDPDNDGTSHWSSSSTSLFLFMIIGLPVIAFVLVVSCVSVCCYRRCKKARMTRSRAPADISMELVSTPTKNNASGG